MKKKAFFLICVITMLFAMLVSCNGNQKVKITFDAQGGTKCKTITLDQEAESLDLPETTRENYDFKGWFFDESLTQAVPDPLPKDQYPTESTTFYAGWDEIYYTISFRVESRTLSSKKCYLGDTITAADYPSLDDYPEYYWEYETFSVTRGMTIQAKKRSSVDVDPDTFSVEYIVSGVRYAYYSGAAGTVIGQPADPTPAEDVYFVGWSIREGGDVVASLPTKISSSDVRYYAQFRSVPDSTDYLTYREETQGGVTSVVITGLTAEGMYQQEIGIPERIGGKTVTAIGYADNGTRSVSSLRVFKSTALASVYLPKSLRTIGAWAFSDCTALEKVVNRGSDLSYIGRGAFAGCTALTSFDLTDRVTVVDDYAFSGLTLRKTNTKIGNEVKESLPTLWQTETWYETDMALSDFSVGSGSVLSEIGSYGFFRCKDLERLLLPSVMTGINYLSFAESGLTDIRVYAGGNFNAVDGAVYSSNGRILYYYPLCGKESFVIPAGVTQVSDNAFRGNKNLVSVSFADSVVTIGSDCFRGCAELENVTFGEDSSLANVLSGAFADCQKIETVTFPKQLINFFDRAFENDIALTELNFAGKGVTAIGDYAFYGCKSLRRITLPERTASVGEYAFYGCSSLYEFGLNVNETALVYIGDYAFCDCTELGSVYLPDTLKFIGDYAFCGLTKKMKMELTSNDLSSLECLGERAFCNTSIMEFTLRGKLVSADRALSLYGKNYTLGKYAFADCTALKNFSFSPVTVYSEVPEGFLYGCTALTGLSFTYNIKMIGDYALYGCTALKTVNFNARMEDSRQMIETIGDYAFAGCRSLLGGVGIAKLLPSSLLTLGEGAFSGCTSVTEISVPENLQIISAKAFYGCTSLRNITYDKPTNTSLHTFGENCFYGCISLGRDNALALPASLGLKTEGKGFIKNPFFGCTSLSAFSFPNGSENELLTEGGVIYYRDLSNLYAFPTAKMGGPVEIPSSVAVIQDYAFYGATLTKLTFIDNASVDTKVTMVLVTIGDYAFADSGLTEVTLSSRVQTVGAHAFENCALSSLEISRDYYRNGDKINGVEYVTGTSSDNSITIGDYAFFHTTLGSIIVANRVTSIGAGAFASCFSLSDIDFSDAVAGLDNTLSLGNSVFEDDTFLQEVTLPARLIYLGENAFRNCYNIERVFFTEGSRGLTLDGHALSGIHFLYEISLPANVVSLGEGVFSDDTRLKYFYFPDALTVAETLVIPEEAFLGDARLDSLTVPGYVTEIGTRAYYGTCLHEVSFEEGLYPLTIGDYAFAEAANLTVVELPDNCVSIGDYAFYHSQNLSDVFYTDTHYKKTKLNDYLAGANVLRDVYVKNFFAATGTYRRAETYYTLTLYTGWTLSADIDQELFVFRPEAGAFVPATGIYQMNVDYYAATPVPAPTEGDPCVGVYVCRYVLNLAQKYEQNVEYYSFTEATVSGSEDATYYVCIDDRYVTYYEMEVGDYAFSGTRLTQVNINGRVRSMGENAFSDIASLGSAVVDGKFDTLPAGTFRNDKNLTDVTIGTGITAIGGYAFYDSGVVRIANRTGVSFPVDAILVVNRIDEYAFCKSGLTSLVVYNSGDLTVGENSFLSCASLDTAYVVATAALTCGDFAFGDCSSLRHFTLRADAMTLGTGFAYNASELEDFNVTETGTGNYTIRDNVLYNKDETEIVFYPAGKTGSVAELSASVRSIGDYAFYGNEYLTGILIRYSGSNVVTLGNKSLGEMGNVVIYVASNLVSLYKNEWGVSDVQAYSVNLSGFVLTIQNSGKYYVSAYLGSDIDLVIPGSMTGGGSYYEITGVAKDAFRNNKSLRSVVLSSGIKTVSNGAFRGCTALETVVIGENVTGIKNYAFDGCTSLKNILFDENSSVVSIGNYAFAGCASLESVHLPKRLEVIGSYAFADDVNLTSVTFEEGLLEVKNNAFEDCDSLLSAVFPQTVTTLGNYLFRNCDNMIYIRCLSESVPAIEDKTFVAVPDGIFFFVPGRSLNAYSVDSKWRNHIEKILSADYIYDEAGTTEFKNYVLEPIEGNEYRLVAYIGNESHVKLKTDVAENVVVTAVGENAFASFVESIEIGLGVTTIDANAFTYAVNLRSIVLPSSLVTIGSYAFADLDKLTSVTILNEVYASADGEAKTYFNRGEWADRYGDFYVYTAGEYLPANDTYSSINKYFLLREAYSLEVIDDHAFYNCTGITSFVFPQSLRTIGRYAFSCAEGKTMNLSSVVFEHNDILGTEGMRVTIEEYAFAKNTELLSIEMNCYLAYLGEGAFSGCSTMTSLYLNYEPTKAIDYLVTEVPDGAQKIFENCDKLSVVLPSANDLKRYKEKWSTGADSYNVVTSAINKFVAKEYVVNNFSYSIVDTNKKTVTAMSYLGTDTEVTFPSTVTIRGTFYNVVRVGRENLAEAGVSNGNVVSDKVTSVVIPGSVAVIGVDAFRGCTGLTEVEVNGVGLTTIESYAFYGCPALKKVRLPASLALIDTYAFASCEKLNGYDATDQSGFYVEDGETVALTFNEGAFADCIGMTHFRLPAQLLTIGAYCFSGCVNLSEVRYGDSFYLDTGEVLGEQDVKLSKVGTYAFRRTAIAEIMLPETVTVVEGYAFAECQELLAVYLFREPGQNGYSDGTITYRTVFDGIRTSNTKIYVPSTSVDRYKTKEGWNQKQVVSRRFHGDFAYEINGEASGNVISGTVTLTAYRGTEKDLVIPDSIVLGGTTYWVTAIAAYFGTPILEKVVFKPTSHVYSIGKYAFAGCTALREIRLPGADVGSYQAASEVEIGEHAFENCTSLTDIHLPQYMTYLSAYLFHNCSSLEEITLPETIGESTGKDETITENGGIIGNGSFYGCTSLARIRALFNYPIGATTTVYGSSVFYQAGMNVKGGLRIVVPAVYVINFTNNWVVGTGDYFSFAADTMLYGDYLVQEEGAAYKLLQYRGDAEVTPLDCYFAGKAVVSVDDSVLASETVISYYDFVLRGRAEKGGSWTLVSYTGTDDLDLRDLTVLGRRITAIDDDVTVTTGIKVIVDSEIEYYEDIANRINITEEN